MAEHAIQKYHLVSNTDVNAMDVTQEVDVKYVRIYNRSNSSLCGLGYIRVRGGVSYPGGYF